MKNLFYGYYRPTPEEFADLWADCWFVLDANALLNFYRYSPETNKIFFEVLSRVSERLWIPHQVGLEYQENRLAEILRQKNIYEEIREKLSTTQNELQALLSKEHSSINVKSLSKKISSTFDSIRQQLEKHEPEHPNLLNEDTIRNSVTQLLDQKVGLPYAKDRLDEIYKIGEKRYAHDIPPGFRDKSKKESKAYGDLVIESKYGDLIIWFQMIDKAKQTQKPIVFITDDAKEDWWWEKSGQKIGPRAELITEMKQQANVSYYMYAPNQFIAFAKDYLGITVKQAVIDEVRDVTESKSDWKSEVIEAFRSLGGEADLNEVYEHIRQTTSRSLPPSWQVIIRRTIYNYCSDRDAYLGGEDLFERLDKGHWRLKQEYVSEHA